MLIPIINSLFYFAVLITYLVKQKRLDLYFAILGSYALVALIGTYNYATGIFTNEYNLSIFRLFYLFIVVLICLKPYRGLNITQNNLAVCENKYIFLLLTFFIVSGIISAYFTLPKAITLKIIDDWGGIRQEVYAGQSSVTLYDSSFEKFFKNCYSYLSPFGVVIAFYQLTKPKINKVLTLLLFAIWFINSYASATLVASRGMIIMLAMKVAVLYFIFRGLIPKKRKIVFIALIGTAAVFLATYIIAVTEARFGSSSSDSVLEYLGHSMYSFADGIMRTMHDYAWGRYQFGWIYRMLGYSSDFSWTELGCTHGTAFMTYVGNIYVDFGPIGTIVVAILLSLLVDKYTHKKQYRLSDLVIIAFSANWFVEGVFVFSSDQSLLWFMAFVVYFIVRFIESKSPVVNVR